MTSASRAGDFCIVWAATMKGNADSMAITATAARHFVLLRIPKPPLQKSFDLGQFAWAAQTRHTRHEIEARMAAAACIRHGQMI
jgi:hypothetical protein